MKKSLLLLISLFSLSLGACGSAPESRPSLDPQPTSQSTSEQTTSVNEQIYQIYQLYLSNGGTQTYDEWLASIKGEKGDPGKDGKDGVDGKDGTDGVSIVSIEKTGTDGNVDTYTITLSNGNTSTFTVTNGRDSFDENPQGLAFYLQDDDTYYVGIGNAFGLKNIDIPSTYMSKPVTGIMDRGLSELGNIWHADLKTESITLPDTIKYIGKEAFYYNDALISINIPDSVIEIGEMAFAHCTSLTSINIPDSVTVLGKNAFYDCYGLESIALSNNIKAIDDGTFHNCSSLTFITIPNSVTSIGKRAFEGCTSLFSVEIGNGVSTIDEYAFSECKSLVSISFGESLNSIDDSAFSLCAHVYEIINKSQLDIVPESAASEIEYLSDKSESKLSIDNNGFVTYPKENENVLILYIGNDKEVVIPNIVTTISHNAFSNSSSLESITIPISVTSIGTSSLFDCDIYFGGTIEQWGLVNKDFYWEHNPGGSLLKTIHCTDGDVDI